MGKGRPIKQIIKPIKATAEEVFQSMFRKKAKVVVRRKKDKCF